MFGVDDPHIRRLLVVQLDAAEDDVPADALRRKPPRAEPQLERRVEAPVATCDACLAPASLTLTARLDHGMMSNAASTSTRARRRAPGRAPVLAGPGRVPAPREARGPQIRRDLRGHGRRDPQHVRRLRELLPRRARGGGRRGTGARRTRSTARAACAAVAATATERGIGPGRRSGRAAGCLRTSMTYYASASYARRRARDAPQPRPRLFSADRRLRARIHIRVGMRARPIRGELPTPRTGNFAADLFRLVARRRHRRGERVRLRRVAGPCRPHSHAGQSVGWDLERLGAA